MRNDDIERCRLTIRVTLRASADSSWMRFQYVTGWQAVCRHCLPWRRSRSILFNPTVTDATRISPTGEPCHFSRMKRFVWNARERKKRSGKKSDKNWGRTQTWNIEDVVFFRNASFYYPMVVRIDRPRIPFRPPRYPSPHPVIFPGPVIQTVDRRPQT